MMMMGVLINRSTLHAVSVANLCFFHDVILF